MVNVDIRVSSHLKEELAWPVDKRLWVIGTIMLLLRRLASYKVFNCCIRVDTVLCLLKFVGIKFS